LRRESKMEIPVQEEDRTWQLIRVPNTTRRQLNITSSQQNTIGRQRDIMKSAAMRRPRTILKSLEDMDSTRPTTPEEATKHHAEEHTVKGTAA